jgi:hypothetical protein
MEQWKIIPGIEDYEVSNEGNFRRATPGSCTDVNRPLKTYYNKVTGYYNVTFGIGPKGKRRSKTFAVHKIIAMTWIPNPDNLPFVRHKNAITTDNRVENLYWSEAQYANNAVALRVTSSKGDKLEFKSITDFGKYLGLATFQGLGKILQQGRNEYKDRRTGIVWTMKKI